MKRKKKLDIIAIMLTIVLLILIGVNISLLSNKLLAPVYANNKVKKEYEEIIAKRNEEIKLQIRRQMWRWQRQNLKK